MCILSLSSSFSKQFPLHSHGRPVVLAGIMFPFVPMHSSPCTMEFLRTFCFHLNKNKLIKTREKNKSVLVKSLNSNSESSNLKFKELCLAFANFSCLTAVFSWFVMVQWLTKKRLRINFFATLLQTELNISEVALFTTNENKP